MREMTRMGYDNQYVVMFVYMLGNGYFKYISIFQGMQHLQLVMDIHYLDIKTWNSHLTHSFMDSLDGVM